MKKEKKNNNKMNRATTQNITSYENIGMGKVTVTTPPPNYCLKVMYGKYMQLKDCMTSVTKDNQPSESDDEVWINVMSSWNNIFVALKKKHKDLYYDSRSLEMAGVYHYHTSITHGSNLSKI